MRKNANLLLQAVDVKNAVMNVLESQNNIIIGEELFASSSIEEQVFVEADFNSEILFDTIPVPRENEQSVNVPIQPTMVQG